MTLSRSLIIIVFVFAGLAAVFYILLDSDLIPYENAKTVVVVQKWNLPEVLDEVSGIVFLGDQKIAAIQDEDGIIFIYNLETSVLEQEIPFGKAGDYEGIALAGSTAYVLRSDGAISQVSNFMDHQSQTTVYESPFKGSYNFEGLSYDTTNNRLLLALKANGGDFSRPVYAFDLTTKTYTQDPLFRIRFDDPILDVSGTKNKKTKLYPSEISIHPETGKLYVLEGVRPKLLILDTNGVPEKLYVLNRKQFPQAEGLTFGSRGEIYISNEARGGTATLLHIQLN